MKSADVIAELLEARKLRNSALYARASPIEGCIMGMGVTAYALQTIALLGLTGMRPGGCFKDLEPSPASG